MLLDQCSIKTLVSTHSQKLPKQTAVTAAQGNKYVKQGSVVTSPGLGDTNENFWTFSSIFWLVSLWQFRTQPICHSLRQNMPVVSQTTTWEHWMQNKQLCRMVAARSSFCITCTQHGPSWGRSCYQGGIWALAMGSHLCSTAGISRVQFITYSHSTFRACYKEPFAGRL